MCSGFIQLHRKFLEWEWYDDHNTKMVFIHLLLKANYKPKNWRGEEIKRGQFVTSTKTLSNELQLSVQQIRTCLTKLESTGEIDKQATNKLTKITICKYDSYQSFENDSNKQTTREQQTDNKQITNNQQQHNKERKKERNNSCSIEDGDKSPTHAKEKKEVKSLEDRENDFRVLLWNIVKEKRSQYQDEKTELKKFFDYWTERSPKGRKMKFEKEKTFDPAKRLDTWFSNKRERKASSSSDIPKGMDAGTFYRNKDRSQFEGEGLRKRFKTLD